MEATKEWLQDKLKELGVVSRNCYPKKSIKVDGVQHFGLFGREMDDDFYIYNQSDKKIYLLKKPYTKEGFVEDVFNGKKKYLVPIDRCELFWEETKNVEYRELEDTPFKEMTLRDYACIHLRIPLSDREWLNKLIKGEK